MSKLIIKFLINYDSAKLIIFPDFESWNWLYLILENNMDETEDDQNESQKYPFNLNREVNNDHSLHVNCKS